jgi:hypothetical protein
MNDFLSIPARVEDSAIQAALQIFHTTRPVFLWRQRWAFPLCRCSETGVTAHSNRHAFKVSGLFECQAGFEAGRSLKIQGVLRMKFFGAGHHSTK